MRIPLDVNWKHISRIVSLSPIKLLCLELRAIFASSHVLDVSFAECDLDKERELVPCISDRSILMLGFVQRQLPSQRVFNIRFDAGKKLLVMETMSAFNHDDCQCRCLVVSVTEANSIRA